jgi:tetratricopeptide (TPR) repeat protein
MKLKKESVMKPYILLIAALSIGVSLSAKDYYRDDETKKMLNRAHRYTLNGKLKQAVNTYLQVIRSRKDQPEAYFNLGLIYLQTKQYHEAIDVFRSTLALKPDYPKAARHLGDAYMAIDRKGSAKTVYEQALKSEPNDYDTLTVLAKIYASEDFFDKAIALYQKALMLQPPTASLLFDLADTYNLNNQSEEATELYQKILVSAPNNVKALHGMGYSLKKLNRIDEAVTYYKRILEINPSHIEARFGLGIAFLTAGNKHPENWPQGWAGYEERWNRQERQPVRRYKQPMWKGSNLTGKTLLIWSEQGLGDTFEFVRYAQVAKQNGAQKVIVATQDAAYNIIKLCPYIDQVIRFDEQPPAYDYHIPMLSMPHYTKTQFDTVPHEIPYLYADTSLIEEWKEILSDDPNFKIGICWQGNPNYTTQNSRATAATKFMTVSDFLPLMDIPGVSVYSLQKTTGTDQLDHITEDVSLITFEGDFDTSKGRFMDTAAVIKNMDLVITIDTSICHLAAGLGVPTWNLLPLTPDWRWMLDCDNTPWYPNMRLFRQSNRGNWTEVMDAVVTELKAHLNDGKPLLTFTQPFA